MTDTAVPWRSIFEHSTLAIARAEVSGTFIEANRSYHSLVGYSPDELRQIAFGDQVLEEDRSAYQELLAKLRSGERLDFQFETRYRRKDGQFMWVLDTVSLMDDRPTSRGFFVCIAQDLTARKHEEAALRKQNEIFGKIFEHAPVMISFLDADGRIMLVNPEWERTLGWTNQELIEGNQDALALCYPDPDTQRKIVKSIALPQHDWAETTTRTKDGRIRETAWVWTNSLGDGTVITFGRDITEQKQFERRLRRNEAYLVEAQRLGHIGSWACDITQTDIFLSAEMRRMLGFDPDDGTISVPSIRERIHPEDWPAFDRAMDSMRNSKDDFGIYLRFVLPDGSMKHVHSIGHPILTAQGDLVEFTGIVVDLTERKLAEESRQRSFDQLRALAGRVQSAREEERTRAAREIHDELGQALTAIKIDFSSWLHELTAEQRQHEKAASILNLLDRTIKSVRRISSELRPGILDDLGLSAAIEWAAEEFQVRTGIQCSLTLPKMEFRLDSERATALFRIFQETLTNIARHAYATRVDVHLAQGPAGVTLEVRDNGRGATPEQLAAHTSLGIRGMRERALLLSGELLIRGSAKDGTTVTVRLPKTAGGPK